MDRSLTITNGGTIYFKVVPYFSGNTGTYNLNLNITRTAITTVDDIENEAENLISVYPNPARDILKITGADIEGHLYQVNLTDLQGRVIYSQAVKNASSEIQISLDYIPNGIYFVTLFTDQTTISKKIIVHK